LVINADDFGFTDGVNRGIIEAYAVGAVTSTSVMVNMPGWDDAVARLRDRHLTLGIGLHLNLVVGTPLTHAPTLTDAHTGRFHSLQTLAWRAATGRVRLNEVRAECEAQFGRLSWVGVRITHVDSHRHTHCLPGFFSAVREAARSAGVGVIRVPREATQPARGLRFALRRAALQAGVATSGARAADVRAEFFGMSLQAAPDFLDGVLRRLDALPALPSELMVHPGYSSPELEGLDSYTAAREAELRALLSPPLRTRLQKGDIELVNFSVL
jgi:predicted glycoside hydrolase/deacetylase ChbG (UPF0249 family)